MAFQHIDQEYISTKWIEVLSSLNEGSNPLAAAVAVIPSSKSSKAHQSNFQWLSQARRQGLQSSAITCNRGELGFDGELERKRRSGGFGVLRNFLEMKRRRNKWRWMEEVGEFTPISVTTVHCQASEMKNFKVLAWKLKFSFLVNEGSNWGLSRYVDNLVEPLKSVCSCFSLFSFLDLIFIYRSFECAVLRNIPMLGKWVPVYLLLCDEIGPNENHIHYSASSKSYNECCILPCIS